VPQAQPPAQLEHLVAALVEQTLIHARFGFFAILYYDVMPFQVCIAGTYTDHEASTTCITCPLGYQCTASGPPVACGAGTSDIFRSLLLLFSLFLLCLQTPACSFVVVEQLLVEWFLLKLPRSGA